VEHALLKPEFLQKSQDTLMQHYGVKTPMKSPLIREKLEQSNIKNFGVANPMQNIEVQNKQRKTNMEKYGVENPAVLPETTEKMFKTMAKNDHNGRLSSKGEREILEFVKSLGFDAKKGYIGGAKPKELDIKVSEKKIAIEYNGAFWHCEKQRNFNKNAHLDKMIGCKAHGYKLLQFWDFEWLERQEQIKSFLTSALGKNQIKIHGRKTEIKEVPKEEANKFLDKYHILGKCNFKMALGLYYKKELVSMITLGMHHRNNTELVLNRYIGKYNVSVRGGLQKLTKYAVSQYGPITTWIDLRMSDGSAWIKAGWKHISTLKPDYFYYNANTTKVVSKQSRQKRVVNTPDDVTEHEHALKDGLYRVYDCGKLKLVYNGI
jgi:hypothetical protein